MANINPGPAQAQTSNTVLEVVAVNTQVNSNPQGANGLRLLASGRAISVNATGDVAVLPVINASRWNVQAVIGSNMGSMRAPRLRSRSTRAIWARGPRS